MASFREQPTKNPRETNSPRRRTPTRPSNARHRMDDEYTDMGSEAASRHEMYVPVAYPVAEPVAEAHAIDDRDDGPHPSVHTREDVESGRMPTLSYESSNREPENSVYNESALGTAYDESALGTEYSIYSGDTNTNTNTNSFRGNGDRFIGTTEWARQQESQRSRFTEDTNDSSDADPWAGPGRPEDELYARADSRDYDSHGRRRQAGGRAPLHDLPQVPFKEASFKSGLSQDMNGFPELEAHAADKNSRYQTAEERDITAPHPSASSNAHHFRNLSGTGAAAAAAADAANAAAEREKEKRRLEKANAARAREESKKGPTSGSAKSTRRPKPPMPHGSASVRDTGETKEEAAAGQGSSAGGSAFHDSAIEAGQTVGDPFEDGARGGNGATDEYAVATNNHVIFTPLMFILCGILLFWEFSINGWTAESLSENPSYGPSVETLVDAGAKRTDLIVEDGDWWRLWTPMFLHAGVVHFLFNMLGFLQVGAMVERVFGWWRVGAIYLVAGVFGTIVSAIFVPTQVMVGASGAIFGVFGALWGDLWQNWSVYQNKCSTLSVLATLTTVNIILGLMPYLDNFAHTGGMLMGFLMGLGLLVQKREDYYGDRLGKKCYQRTLQMVSLIAVPTLLILGLSLLYGRSDPSEWCGWCKNISCVEFPPGDNSWWACDECSTAGYAAEQLSDGTISITCPDLSVETSDTCSAATTASLTECCIELCL